MKNSVVLLLMILLPLQTAWGVAALFCQHESNSTQWHWGHHEHQADAACQQIIKKLTQPSTQSYNKAVDTNLLQHGSNSKKSDQAHAFQMANHSDHLQTNPLGLNPPVFPPLMSTIADFLSVQLVTTLPLFYQPPVLEQPKPPLWPV